MLKRGLNSSVHANRPEMGEGPGFTGIYNRMSINDLSRNRKPYCLT
jgi:hypothetical protein